jgi:hypothetical protein
MYILNYKMQTLFKTIKPSLIHFTIQYNISYLNNHNIKPKIKSLIHI